MASFIKKQILKHLTKFTRNLSADKINLSTFRGEGELTNLELDCDALQNLMNLPTWLKIENACCNRVHVKIPWTKLKTTPITILLDAVEVQMIACEEPRPPNGPSPIQASASSVDTSYGFTVKVLEGITVNINSITVDFKSPFFNANLQLSQLLLESTNPKWRRSDLKHTFIHDKNLDQVLTFKKLSWQTMRIVANAVNSVERKNSATPLRLITNQSEIMITFRRKPPPTATPKQGSSREEAKEEQYASKHFHDYVILESSLHIDFDNVDLHICEEANSDSTSGLHGGAIQMSLRSLKIDHYPYHKPDRNHFRDYGEVMRERDSWASGIIKKFRKEFAMLREAARSCGNLNATGEQKKSPRLVENCLSVRLCDVEIHQVTMDKSKNQGSGHLIRSTRKELHLPDDMLLFHFIHTKYYYPDGRDFPAPSDNTFMQINAPLIHAHWNTLIWLNGLASTTVKAVQKMLEDLGILPNSEENSPSNNLSSGSKEEDEAPHVDVRIQVLMPKIFIPGPIKENSPQPLGLEIQASKATVTNCREGYDCHRQQLRDTLESIELQRLAKFPDTFPSDSKIDMPHLDKLLKEHSLLENSACFNRSFNAKSVFLKRNSLIDLAKEDVWSVNVDNIWVDFIMPFSKEESTEKRVYGFLASKDACSDAPYIEGEKNPFMDSFPAQIWIGKSTLPDASSQQIAMHAKPNTVAKSLSAIDNTSSKNLINTSEFKSSIEDVSSDSSNSSPRIRNMRNRKLRDYYQSSEPEVESSSIDEKAEETKCDVITTYILLHTKESLRLQVDHHQYVFLMSLLDMIDDVGRKLEESSKVANLSESSPCSSPDYAPRRTQKPKGKLVETTSVRIDAPYADLFLILEPDSSEKKTASNREKFQQCNSDTVSIISDTVPLTREAKLQELRDKIRDRMEITNTVTLSNQESPMWSDTTSESISIQDSENNISMSGESYACDPLVQEQVSPLKVPFSQESRSGIISSSPSNQSVLSDKSLSDEAKLAFMPENQALSVSAPINKDIAKLGKSKSGSSGYESSSCESIPVRIPDNGTKYVGSNRRYHSRESSIASDDQFVMIQVERKGTIDSSDSTSVRFVKDEVHQSSICGDSSSLSSQAAPINNTTPAGSEFDSKDPSVSESMQDNKEFVAQSNKLGEPDDLHAIEEDLKSCSVVVMHISNGVEIAVDSNDTESSVVKLNALTVNVAELGSMERRKANSVFDKYSCKKIRKLWSEQQNGVGSSTDTPNFSLRVDTGPLAGRLSSLAAENGYIQLTASSVLLALKASTLGSFGGFFDEEGPSKITPMSIKASDVKLAIEGEPSIDPQVPPEIISLLVHSATINRTDDGTFHINSISAGNLQEKDSTGTNDQVLVPDSSPSEQSFSTYTDANLSKHSITANSSICWNDVEEACVSNRTVDFLEEEISKQKSVIENLRNELQLAQSQKDSLENELCLLKEKSNSSQ